MDSELEALEEAADGLEAPLEPSTGFLNPGLTAHQDRLCLSACASAASRSPSFDPSENFAPQPAGGSEVFSWPSSEKERDWYSGVNLAGTEAEQTSKTAGSSSIQTAAGGQGNEFISSGLSFNPATGPVDVGAAVAFAHQSLPGPSIKHCWEQGFWSQIFGPPRDLFEGLAGTSYKRPDAPFVGFPEEPKAKSARSSGAIVGAAQPSSFLR